MTHIGWPLRVDGRGRTAGADDAAWIRGLVEQVLFTTPGERVMRPTFGCGLAQLVFAPNSEALASATQVTVQGALQQWLGDLIQVQGVQVHAEDDVLTVTVSYVVRQSQQARVATFTRPGP